MVQGMTNGELNRMLGEWIQTHGDCFTVTRDGYYRRLEFVDDRSAVLFLLTFKPNRDHWWRNAVIESQI